MRDVMMTTPAETISEILKYSLGASPFIILLIIYLLFSPKRSRNSLPSSGNFWLASAACFDPRTNNTSSAICREE